MVGTDDSWTTPTAMPTQLSAMRMAVNEHARRLDRQDNQLDALASVPEQIRSIRDAMVDVKRDVRDIVDRLDVRNSHNADLGVQREGIRVSATTAAIGIGLTSLAIFANVILGILQFFHGVHP